MGLEIRAEELSEQTIVADLCTHQPVPTRVCLYRLVVSAEVYLEKRRVMGRDDIQMIHIKDNEQNTIYYGPLLNEDTVPNKVFLRALGHAAQISGLFTEYRAPIQINKMNLIGTNTDLAYLMLDLVVAYALPTHTQL